MRVTLPSSQPINASAGVKSRFLLTVRMTTLPATELMLLRANRPCCTLIVTFLSAARCCTVAEPPGAVSVMPPANACTNSVSADRSISPVLLVIDTSAASERTVLRRVTFVPALISILVVATKPICSRTTTSHRTAPELPVVGKDGGITVFATVVIVTNGCSPTA